MSQHDTTSRTRQNELVSYAKIRKKTEESSTLKHGHDPLGNITCRIGNGACAARHITTARQTGLFHPMNESRRTQSLLRLQRQYGNRFVQQIATGHRVQTKLRIGQSGDVYERETDEVANAATRMSGSQTEGVKQLGIGEVNARAGSPDPGIEPFIEAIKGTGQPLPKSTRSLFAQRFGYDFSPVRISRPTFTRWHSITSLELVGGTWRRVNTPSGDANEVELGTIRTDTP